MEFFRQLIEGIVAAWGKLNTSARVNIGLAAAAVAVAVTLLVTWGGRPNYVVLYSNLAGEDVSDIVTQLSNRGVPYQIAAGGTAIRVPASRVYELRNELAAEGLPAGGGVGFEIFDRPGFGVTDFQQRVQYERALSTEVARTISELDDVRNARVRVTRPEKALYAEEEEEPSASVLISLARPGALSGAQVSAILHLVAAGVEGLKQSNIAVVDTQGNVLAAPTDEPDSAAALTSKQRAEVTEVEREKEQKASRALKEILGPRRCVVTVSATLDFDEVQETEVEYREGIPSSEESETENVTTIQPLPTGPVGVTAGVPPGLGATAGVSTEKDMERTVTTNKVPETHRTTKKATGTIKRLVVFAGIEGTYQESEEGEETTYVPVSSSELDTFSQLVMAAVGADEETRGDLVTVSDMQFGEAAIEMELPGMPWYSGLPLAQIILGVAALGAFMVLRRTLSRMAAAPRPAVPEIAPGEKYEVPEEAALKERVKDEIGRLSREQPEIVANVLRTWLVEED